MSNLRKGVTPVISVLIISYNFEKYLDECIKSILAQTLRPYEIIIVDDCSTDRSWEIISTYASENPMLIKAFQQEENVGQYRNGRCAWRKASGDLISALDGDDRWLPRKLELEWQALEDNPEAQIAYSNVHIIDEHGTCTSTYYDGNGPVPPSGDVFIDVIMLKMFSHTGYVLRNELMYRSVFEEIGYDENIKIYLDLDFKIRATARFPVAYSGEVLVDYRFHNQGIHATATKDLEKDELAVWRKNIQLLAERPEPQAKQRVAQLKQRFHVFDTQEKYGLSYHVFHADLCQQRVGFVGKNVLEVGGSLPRNFVFEYLRVNSWTGVESPDFAHFSKSELSDSTTKIDLGSTIGDIENFSGQGFLDVNLEPDSYNLFYASIEELPPEHYGQYDLVFSIAAFEHVLKFPQAIDKMFRALKPGGKLFALFSPIWSAFNGHRLPEIKDKSGKIFNFTESPIPPWGHLLLRPSELHQHLLKHTDNETAARIIYLVFTAPFINRFFTEDYLQFIENSEFSVQTLEAIFPREIDRDTQERLERNHPGRKHFANNGICAILAKPT